MTEIRQDEGGRRLLVKASALDRSNVEQLKVNGVRLASEVPEVLEIDLREVDFIDSSGIGALLAVANALPEAARPLRLVNVGPAVLSVLELVRVHRVFEIAPRS